MIAFLQHHKKITLRGTLILLSFALMLLDVSERHLVSLLTPIQRLSILLEQKTSDIISLLNVRKLRRENLELKRKYFNLIQERERWALIAHENERLRKILDFKKREPYETLAAHVIGYDPSNWFHTIKLDKGEADGVQIEAPVIGIQGENYGLVGRVMEVTPNTSTVLLILDQNSAVGAKIARIRYRGIVEGTNSDKCHLRYLVQEADVVKGDVVVTSGDGSIFPEGIPIGRVVEVQKKDYELFCDVKVLPLIEFTKLEEVLIIKGEGFEK